MGAGYEPYRLPRLPQLDGVRALAILMVLANHLAPASWWQGHRFFEEGHHGVTLFFVLSGFLISWPLMAASQAPMADRWVQLQTFFWRRSIRIFPAYGLMLLLTAIVYGHEVQQWWPYLTYTYNWQVWLSGFNPVTPEGDWGAMVLRHTWSLCIEEQFYLLWPWLVLFVPTRFRWQLLLGLLVLSRVFRWVGLYYFHNHATDVHTIPALLPLVAGASLAAYLQQQRHAALPKWLLPVATLAWLLVHMPPDSLRWPGRFFLMSEGVFPTLLSLALVWHAYENGPSLWGKLMRWGPLRWIGEISYGLYLYNAGIFYFAHQYLAPNWGPATPQMALALLLILTASSYYLIERPLLRWGRRKPL